MGGWTNWFRRKNWWRLGLIAILILGALAYHHGVWAAGNRLVTLSVDGKRLGFVTDATTVQEALDRAQVHLGADDLVEPSVTTPINTRVFFINVYRAKPVIVVDKGREIRVNTPYQNPKLIVQQSAKLSVYPEDGYEAEPINNIVDNGTIGYQIIVLRSIPLKITVDGRTFGVRSRQLTVGDMLTEKGVVLGPDDLVNFKLTAAIAEDMHVVVTRVGRAVVAREEVIPAPIQTVFDNNLPAGSIQIKQAGKDGKQLVTYEVTYHNGKEVRRKKLQVVVELQPVTRIIVRGVTYAGDVWAALRFCESGGNYADNTGNGFYGAYQFTIETWMGYAPAGYGNVLPSDAPPAAQDIAAQNLQARRGWEPWPACAAKLGLL